MKVIFGLGHPAHFHLFKNVLRNFKNKEDYKIVITDKDVLKKLLEEENFEYVVLASSNANEGMFKKLKKMFSTSRILYKIAKEYKPDLFVGCLSQLAWVARFTGKKSIFNAEDDFSYTFIQGLLTYPFVTHILTPAPVKVGMFSYKQIKYSGFHKLAYLHPKQFTPDVQLKNKYISAPKYFLIRTVNQNAYHDINAKGISNELLHDVINILKQKGEVYITSESKLPQEFEKYQLKIRANDIHHILFYADLFIGDSQSMTVEAAMLGTPSIRYNSFKNKISVIDELENKYKLTYSLNTGEPEKLKELIKELVAQNVEIYRERRMQMLNDKINVTDFLSWFIQDYPTSNDIMRKDPAYQMNFK